MTISTKVLAEQLRQVEELLYQIGQKEQAAWQSLGAAVVQLIQEMERATCAVLEENKALAQETLTAQGRQRQLQEVDRAQCQLLTSRVKALEEEEQHLTALTSQIEAITAFPCLGGNLGQPHHYREYLERTHRFHTYVRQHKHQYDAMNTPTGAMTSLPEGINP